MIEIASIFSDFQSNSKSREQRRFKRQFLDHRTTQSLLEKAKATGTKAQSF